ncbi:MAG: TRAP transporter TatT component family protein, partial [Planctomycetota bacterium]|nr:TRAP transporter TatT component family protein [Planctomycetota bacterium]
DVYKRQGVAWGGAISLAKDDPDLVADQSLAIALLDRALALDEAYDAGAIHAALISVEMVRRDASGKAEERAKAHFDRAVELSGGKLASPLVAYAEDVCIPLQDRKQFTELLQRALAIDPDAKPEWRMVNLILQRRARWLLAKADDLFAE